MLSPDLLLAMQAGPPPQEVLNKRPLWLVFMWTLGCVMLLRVATLDIIGGLLCGLLLLLALTLVRDGMTELPRFGLIFGILCGLNFVFSLVPTLGNLAAGRSERHINPEEVKIHPFFDHWAGLTYNLQSAAILAMPPCQLLGAWLGLSAHRAVRQHTAAAVSPGLLEEECGAGPGPYGAVCGGSDCSRSPFSQAGSRFQGAAHKLGR
mmetsp:Transcript_91779/g.259853  ORF Transcript_91779/g.259853 Transcript_91779/m.259853 type:complete len:207 (-) Transcript_91779:20-640(-)